MATESVTAALHAYKRTAALIAFFDLGVDDLLNHGVSEIPEIADQLRLDPEGLTVLFECLRQIGAVAYANPGGWKLTPTVQEEAQTANFRRMLALERILIREAVTPDRMVDAVRRGRVSAIECARASSPQLQRAYADMCDGDHAKLAGTLIYRKIKTLPPGAVFLEIGRCPGAIGRALSRFRPSDTYVTLTADGGMGANPTADKPHLDSICDATPSVSAICLYNCIHYYDLAALEQIIRNVARRSQPGLNLWICDFFADEDNPYSSSRLTDWLTHGGLHNRTLAHARNLMLRLGVWDMNTSLIQGTDLHLLAGKMREPMLLRA